MKKICRLLSAMLIMAMVLGGCGKANTPDTETDTQQTESQNETENVVTSEVETEESTEAVSETTTEVSTETESEITTDVETEPQTESEVPSEPEAPSYTYTDMDKTMYAKSSVNVRDLPSTDGNKLGGLSKAQEVHVTGQCNETNWYRIEYNGGIGYVAGSYLVNDKPVEETPTEPSQPEDTAVDTQNEVCPYELYVIYYDNQGYPYFYGKWGGSANMDAENLTKTDTCMKQMENYLTENFKVTTEDGWWQGPNGIAWRHIGTYQGTKVVVRYVDLCNNVILDSPESRGISTAGNGIW